MCIINLRPHHLLCTQSYEGRGYSPEFVTNMDHITDQLRNSENTRIRLTLGTDDLCRFCPNKLAENLCNSEEHIRLLDQRVMDTFRLKETDYSYQNLIQMLRGLATPQMIQNICGDCSWYLNDSCSIQKCMAKK